MPPDPGHCQGCHDVPDAPPRCDQRHTTQATEEAEDQQQPQSRIADPDLEGHGLALGDRQLESASYPVTQTQSQSVVEGNRNGNYPDPCDEQRPVPKQ